MTATTRPRLGHLAIRARDAVATRRFYEQGMGLRFLASAPRARGASTSPTGS